MVYNPVKDQFKSFLPCLIGQLFVFSQSTIPGIYFIVISDGIAMIG